MKVELEEIAAFGVIAASYVLSPTATTGALCPEISCWQTVFLAGKVWTPNL